MSVGVYVSTTMRVPCHPPQRHEKIGLEMGMERWGLWGSTLCSFM